MAELIDKGVLKSEFDEILTALESKKAKEAISKQEFCECIEILKECVDEQPTTTEAEIRAMAISEFAKRVRHKIMSEIDECADELEWITEIEWQMKEE